MKARTGGSGQFHLEVADLGHVQAVPVQGEPVAGEADRTARRSLRERNRGCPTLRPFRFPDRESNQFLQARRASWHACTSATEATSPSHSRSGVALARVMTRRWTSVSLIFSPCSAGGFADPEQVVEDHAGAPECPGQHQLLMRLPGRRGSGTGQAQNAVCHLPMTSDGDYRRGRHVASALTFTRSS